MRAVDPLGQRLMRARPRARLVWGASLNPFYRAIDALGRLPDGTRVLDLPCGGGAAFRGIRPWQKLDYVAADPSPGMLERARARAEWVGLDPEFVQVDVASLPFADASFDLVICLNGLHSFPDPERTVLELGRRVRPGGRLTIDCVVHGAGRRFDALYRAYERRGIFGPGGTREEIASWLESAGLSPGPGQQSGAIAHFDAVRPVTAR